VPGPTLRVRQGEPVRLLVTNQLDQETTVHWHGVRVPNAMDGVPGLTQPPIRPDETFAYEFTPPDAGTFWYHPHANSLEQLGRGLAGPLIVEEREPIAVDRDVVWFLSDWRLTRDGEIASGFGNTMEAGMSGRVGNTITLNGRVSTQEPARAGERIRLRLVNAALARMMSLSFESHRPVIIAIDGQPCEPHEPQGGSLLLGPAMRIDVVLDMQGEPGQSYAISDDFYDGLSYELTRLTYSDEPPLRSHPLDTPVALPANPLPEPDLAAAERHESMTGDGNAQMAPSLAFKRGQSVVLTVGNQTAWWHPVHFHGHSFRVLTRNGETVPNRQWQDTVLLRPRDRIEVAFVADNPGRWMLHCHVMDHQMTGLMTVLEVV
jgi:FtsP/CotA-like multicopper oxidase with cupredoxin domain